MRKLIFTLISFIIISINCFPQNLKHKYLGQTPPGNEPVLLDLSKYLSEEEILKKTFNFSFSPDGEELFFSYVVNRSKENGTLYTIKHMRFDGNKWNAPETASFAGDFWNVDINFSPDGKYVFFASDREQPNSIGGDIYYCIKTEYGWSDPIYTGSEVNTKYNEVYPSVSAKKNIFFQSTKPGGYGDIDLYRAEWVNGNFTNVENLGPNVNTSAYEADAVIAPDESYILFCSNRPSTGGVKNIYISFQIGKNRWTEAINLGDKVNNGPAGSPTVSTDGKYLFFKKRDGIHWISTDFIYELKKQS